MTPQQCQIWPAEVDFWFVDPFAMKEYTGAQGHSWEAAAAIGVSFDTWKFPLISADLKDAKGGGQANQTWPLLGGQTWGPETFLAATTPFHPHPLYPLPSPPAPTCFVPFPLPQKSFVPPDQILLGGPALGPFWPQVLGPQS